MHSDTHSGTHVLRSKYQIVLQISEGKHLSELKLELHWWWYFVGFLAALTLLKKSFHKGWKIF